MSRKSELISLFENMDKATENDLVKIREIMESAESIRNYTEMRRGEKAEEIRVVARKRLETFKADCQYIIYKALKEVTVKKMEDIQGYQLSLMNTIKILELAGADMHSEEIKELLQPFEEDHMAIMSFEGALKKQGRDILEIQHLLPKDTNRAVKKRLEHINNSIGNIAHINNWGAFGGGSILLANLQAFRLGALNDSLTAFKEDTEEDEAI